MIDDLRAQLAEARDMVTHLQVALETNRLIGTAVGILMASHKIQSDAAFDLLRKASMHTQRKLHDVAEHVVLTGDLRSFVSRR